MIEVGSAPFFRAMIALCLGSFMIFSNVYVTQPLLPMLVETFQVSPLQAGWSLTLTTLTLGCSLLLFGTLSDALGRTRLMILSMAGVLLCSAALTQVNSFEQLLWLRGIQGICLAGLPAIAIAYMGDEFSCDALPVAVGLYISANTLGGIGGRLIGGAIGQWLGWQEVFVVISVMNLFCIGLFVWLLPPSKRFAAAMIQPKQVLSNILDHLKNPLLRVVYIIGGLNFFIFINQYSYATFRLSAEPYYLSAGALGLLFLTYLSGTLGSAISGYIASRIPPPLVIAIGCLIIVVGTLITLMSSMWLIISGFLINAFGFFVAHSTASSWVSHKATHSRAAASSAYLVFYYLGASLGGLYLAPFWQYYGWEGVVLGSIFALTITFSLAVRLHFLVFRA